MEKIAELRAKEAKLRAELKSLTETAEPTADTVEAAKTKAAELEALTAEIKGLESFVQIREDNAAALKAAGQPVNALPNNATGKQAEGAVVEYKCTGVKVTSFSNEQNAYAMGLSLLAAKGGAKAADAVEKLAALGYGQKDMLTSVNSNGGFLVPTALSNEIINNAEQYGVARRNMRVIPMPTPILSVPRITGRLTATPTGEGKAYTEGNVTGNNVELVARKWGVTVEVSTELSDAAIVAIGDLFGFESARAFAYAEDNALFNGDGTAAFNTIKGLKGAFTDLTLSSAAGMQVASGNTAAEVTLADLQALMAKLPAYAYQGAKWYCSAWAKALVFDRLIMAAGGLTGAEMQNGISPKFGGFPVEVTQVLPSSDTNSQILLYFGDLNQAAKFGQPVGSGVTVAVSDQERFSEDLAVWKAREWFDMKVHDIGTTSEKGAVVGLYMANS